MPDISMVHVDQALTNVSIAYHNAQFIADQVFQPIPVSKQSNKYFIYSKGPLPHMDDARRPGARANEINWTLSTDTYFAEGHALAQAILTNCAPTPTRPSTWTWTPRKLSPTSFTCSGRSRWRPWRRTRRW